VPLGGEQNIALLPMPASLHAARRVESRVFGFGFWRQDRLVSAIVNLLSMTIGLVTSDSRKVVFRTQHTLLLRQHIRTLIFTGSPTTVDPKY
jgi:hypothetical protein